LPLTEGGETVTGETSEQRRAARIRQEVQEFENDPRMRAQAVIDNWWREVHAPDIEDNYVDIGGFREPRWRTTCHRGPGDPDFGK
jgi:hypothetical protein